MDLQSQAHEEIAVYAIAWYKANRKARARFRKVRPETHYKHCIDRDKLFEEMTEAIRLALRDGIVA